MKALKNILTTIIIILLVFSISYANNDNSENTNYYPVSINKIKNASNKILIISTRNFTDSKSLVLEKGVHPENKRFFFIAGTYGDSTFITSYPTLDEAVVHLNREKDMLVYVNGYGKTFEGTVTGGQKLAVRYDVNVIMFDWPTDRKPLRITAKNAKKVSNSLSVSIHELAMEKDFAFANNKLSVIFHSMGNFVARDLVKSGYIDLLSEDSIDNIILNAAAVKSYDHDRWVERLKYNNDIYIVINKNDYVLRGASIVRGVRQLGNVALGRPATNANYVNFTDVAQKEHSYYLGATIAEKENPVIFDFYNTVFHGESFEANVSPE